MVLGKIKEMDQQCGSATSLLVPTGYADISLEGGEISQEHHIYSFQTGSYPMSGGMNTPLEVVKTVTPYERTTEAMKVEKFCEPKPPTPIDRKCFKCYRFEYIASKCSNMRIMSFIK